MAVSPTLFYCGNLEGVNYFSLYGVERTIIHTVAFLKNIIV